MNNRQFVFENKLITEIKISKKNEIQKNYNYFNYSCERTVFS